MMAFISKWAVSFGILGITLLIIISDYRIAIRKNRDGITNYADRRRLRGLAVIGVLMALLAAFVQWAAG